MYFVCLSELLVQYVTPFVAAVDRNATVFVAKVRRHSLRGYNVRVRNTECDDVVVVVVVG